MGPNLAQLNERGVELVAVHDHATWIVTRLADGRNFYTFSPETGALTLLLAATTAEEQLQYWPVSGDWVAKVIAAPGSGELGRSGLSGRLVTLNFVSVATGESVQAPQILDPSLQYGAHITRDGRYVFSAGVDSSRDGWIPQISDTLDGVTWSPPGESWAPVAVSAESDSVIAVLPLPADDGSSWYQQWYKFSLSELLSTRPN